MALDLDALVLGPCISAFGSAATYTTRTQTRFSLPGVFDRYHVEVSFGQDGAPVSTMRPIFGARESAFPAGVVAAQGDRLLIDGAVYEVADTQPDGHGHVLLILRLAP